MQILVGVDAGVSAPAGLGADLRAQFAQSGRHSQAAALNAAAKLIDGDVVALLEDDDQWEPQFLELAIATLNRFDFVSSTQLEVLTNGNVVRVNDFATPSGWVMKRKVWQSVGEFDENFRWHLDNDWLGRLRQANITRAHLVEATAPTQIADAQAVRRWLAFVVQRSGGMCQLVRHGSPWPLVKRTVHEESGMWRIARNPTLRAQSENERAELVKKYGLVPW